MLPLLRFASGIVVGVIGVQLLKKANAPETIRSFAKKARSELDKAGEELREATVSSLSAVEKSSANLRAKLTRDAEAPPTETVAADEAAPEPTSSASDQDKNEKA